MTKQLWILYDGRANPIDGTDDASVLCTASSLREARRDARDFGDCYIWRYDRQGDELVNETYVEYREAR